jgi:hypothetical protein
MGADSNLTVGRVVELYGLARPVTSADEIETAQLAALVDIRKELRAIRDEMQGQRAGVPSSAVASAPTPDPGPTDAAIPQPSAPVRVSRKKRAKR